MEQRTILSQVVLLLSSFSLGRYHYDLSDKYKYDSKN